MSGYFGGFSLNKLTDTITSAAHKTQDKLSTAIANIQLDDPQAKLSLKARKHYLQETLGTIDDISKLPPQYQFLEKKCDYLEKVCKRMLVVTKTFEVEGYDYPPNLTESFSDWWSTNKEGIFSFMDSKKKTKKSEPEKEDPEAFLPRSFAQALSKAAKDSGELLKELETEQKASAEEEDEEDEDISSLVKMFDAWADAQYKIDLGKAEMDSLMVKEFNQKLSNMINDDFKKARALRKKVEDSRLKFDTMRYELKLREEEAQAKAKASLTEESAAPTESKQAQPAESQSENTEKETAAEKTAAEDAPSAKTEVAQEPAEKPVQEPAEEPVQEPAEEPAEETAETATTEETHGSEPEKAVLPEDDPEQKLLEKLEDEFVSNTTEAVETMGEITDSSEVISLVKLFHNFQLIYHRQCVRDLEDSMKILNGLDGEEN